MFKIYGEVCKKNIKIYLLPAVLLVILLIIIILIVADLQNASATFTAVVCQQFFTWTGIFLLSPVFMIEQRDNIEEIVLSKAVPIKMIYLIRLAEALIALILFTAGFVCLISLLGGAIKFNLYFIHTLAVALFLGSLSFVGTRFTDNVVSGYLLSFGFYIVQMFLPVDKFEPIKYFYIFTLIRETHNIILIYICSLFFLIIPFIKRN